MQMLSNKIIILRRRWQDPSEDFLDYGNVQHLDCYLELKYFIASQPFLLS